MAASSTDLNPSEYSFEEVWREQQWRLCAPQTDDPDKLLQGFMFFCEHYWYIRHPERGRILFQPFESQVETVFTWLNHRHVLILKARQIGFSTLIATYAFWLTFFYPDRAVLMLSRTEREAIKLLGKSKYGYQFLPEWMKFKGGPVNQTLTTFTFTNNSYTESLPSASDPARGESAYLVVVDELAFLPNSEEAWGAIEPVADVGGRIIMMSTANGEGNLFHSLWNQAIAGHNRFEPLFFPWSANGRDQAWYDARAAELPDWQMAQEYPDNPEDAFLKSGRPIFDLRRLREIEPRDPIAMGYLDESLHFVDDGGTLHVWEWPVKDGRYVIGADPSQGLEHSDRASVHVINARDGHVVAAWCGLTDPDLLGSDILARLGNWYNKALVGVESNMHGLTTLTALRRVKYFPIYYQRSPKYKKSVPTDVLGFRTDQVTKPLMIDELGKELRPEGKLTLWCAETLAELRTFVRTDKGKMQGSPYDDRVISLAIANQMLKFVWFAEFQPKVEPGPGTVGWYQRTLYGNSLDDLMNGKRKTAIIEDRPKIGAFAVRRK
jgi:Terminase large subunit, T4likevirus-type, N-terminal